MLLLWYIDRMMNAIFLFPSSKNILIPILNEIILTFVSAHQTCTIQIDSDLKMYTINIKPKNLFLLTTQT